MSSYMAVHPREDLELGCASEKPFLLSGLCKTVLQELHQLTAAFISSLGCGFPYQKHEKTVFCYICNPNTSPCLRKYLKVWYMHFQISNSFCSRGQLKPNLCPWL